MQNEIIKLTKKYENIRNEDKKPKPKEVAKKVKNKINKYIQILKNMKNQLIKIIMFKTMMLTIKMKKYLKLNFN